MNVFLLRFVDKLLGYPLCLCCFFFKKLKKRKTPEDASRKCFFLFSELGSSIQASTLISRSMHDPKVSDVYFITSKSIRDFLAVMPVFENVTFITLSNDCYFKFIKDMVRAFIIIRKEKIGELYDLELGSYISSFIVFFLNYGRSVGFQFSSLNSEKIRALLYDKVFSYDESKHISHNFNSLSSQKTPFSDPYVPCSVVKKENIYLINASGGALPIRAWSPDNFIKLIKHLLKNDTASQVFLIGSKLDCPANSIVRNGISDARCYDLTGQTDVDDLIKLFARAKALICNDGGLAHFASLFNIEVHVIFGPESPGKFAPIGDNVITYYSNLKCSPCLNFINGRSRKCSDKKCLSAIKYEAVYDSIAKCNIINK